MLERARIYHGVIKGSSFIDGALAYSVFIENYHLPESPPHLYAKGIPVFQTNENGTRYKKETRVFILLKDDDFSTAYVIGKIFDRYKFEGGTPSLKEGQTSLSDPSDQSGISGLGESSALKIWSGPSSILLSENNIIGNVEGKRSFEISKNLAFLGNDRGLLSIGSDSALLADGSIQLIADSGEARLQGSTLSLLASGTTASLKSVKEMEISSPLLIMKSGAFKFQGSLGSAFGPEATVDWNILKGDYKITIGSGNFDLTILEPIGKITLDLGYPLSLGKLEITEDIIVLENQIGEISLSVDGEINLENALASINMDSTGTIELKGAFGSTEKMILGETFVGLIEEVIDEINKLTVPTAVGPSGTPSNSAAFSLIKGKLNTALSLSIKNN